MPKLARRSTRSPAPPSSAGGNNGGLSPDATAFQLLKSQLEKEEWRRLSSRKGGFYDTLVKKGHTLDDAVDGKSMVKEEGFTLQKYEELFFSTMEEEELQEWADRLPDHPKLPVGTKKKDKRNRVSISPSDASSPEDDEEEDYELIGRGGSSGAAVSKKKGKSGAKKNAATQGKKRKKQTTKDEDDDLESDGEDGIPGGKMRRIQMQLFDACLRGKAEFDKFNQKQSAHPKSFKAMKSQAAKTMDIFHKADNEEMVKFKREQMDPIVRKAIAAVNEYVQSQADTLRNEMLEEMIIDNYSFVEGEEGKEIMEDDNVVVDSTGADKSGEDEEKDGAEGGSGGEEEGNETMEDKVDNKGADKSEGDSSDGQSVGEVKGVSQGEVESGGANDATWTLGVIEGSDDKESS